MKTYYYKKLSAQKINELLKRPAIDLESKMKQVKPIIEDVKKNGIHAVIKYAKKFDGLKSGALKVTADEINNSEKFLAPEIKSAIDKAAKNIYKFHLQQKPQSYSIETLPGVVCTRKHIPIDSVGLYIPGGSAVLVSTMLMLGIPAKIAGCQKVVVCSPAKDEEISAELLYAAKVCGIKEFYKVGGSQAIALMAYGTGSIEKVNKIFGPGNQYVTAAKAVVSTDPDSAGCTIDMLAGPSEVLIIADETASPEFAAADLLSQAEHGTDSQSILLTTSETFAKKVIAEVDKQLKVLPRKELAKKSLQNSFILVFENVNDAVEFSNKYAPEHLILNIKNSSGYLKKIRNAGSVFIGEYSPESAGDYASGTNHSLPTYGYAKSIGGVTVESFMKTTTFQKLTKSGLKKLSPVITKLAEVEKLDAHANAVKIRMNK
ncbi:MAG: histidinol dehydrogenase [Ignavibacteriales bacterium]|nr:histidinol dehydrogenase [Ignavibacteriales bacterium]